MKDKSMRAYICLLISEHRKICRVAALRALDDGEAHRKAARFIDPANHVEDYVLWRDGAQVPSFADNPSPKNPSPKK